MVANPRTESSLLSHVIVIFLIILMPTYIVILIYNNTVSLPIHNTTLDLWRF